MSTTVPVEAQQANPFHQLREKDLKGVLETLGAIHDAGAFWERDRGDAIPAIVGGVARLLAQEDEEVRYDLLYKWTMPTDSRKTIRVLTTPVPHDAPPEIFARVLRERPRESSFEVASINGIRGLFCSGWKLVTLADELGRLDRLTTELEEMNQQHVPDADVLLLLLLAKRGPLPACGSRPASLSARTERRSNPLADRREIRFHGGSSRQCDR